MIKPEYIVTWMNFIRNHPEDKRFLECFWESQIKSKHFLIEKIKKYNPTEIAIFGGWYGILAQLVECNIEDAKKILTIDVDPDCFNVFTQIDVGTKVRSLTICMSKFKQYSNIDFVINTSTEHVEQEIYDKWWENIPEGMMYAIQGNNFDTLDEHIRCANSLEEFLEINHVIDPLMTEVIDCNGFDRYMAIAKK
jgi:hypothetical protein